MLNITIKTIPHSTQRYPTVGDWEIYPSSDGITLEIRVSTMSDWRREILVAIHELVEVAQCLNDGVTEDAVNAFDIQYEKDRAAGMHPDDAEPGDDPAAPYQNQHFTATTIERILSQALGVDWSDYDREVVSLP